jgi:hypothetical protein
MTSTQTAIPTPDLVAERPQPPRLRQIVGKVAISLATAVFVPTVLFTLTLLILGLTGAVLVALTWMASAMWWRHTHQRPVSGLLVLALVVMTLRTGIMLATGNAFVYFVQPVAVDLVVATLFLGSAWSARPLVARLAPDFYPMDDALAAHPRVRGLFRGLTLLWGVVILAKGTITLWLLLSLSTVDFVLIKGGAILTLTLLATTATIVWAVTVARQQGLPLCARAVER